MTEVSSPQVAQPSPDTVEAASKDVLLERTSFVDSMLRNKLIDEEFASSGALEKFSVDPELARDALTHILVGDEYGGGHHMPTIIETEANTQVASTVASPDSKRSRAYYRSEQKVRDNGIFRSKSVKITDADGQVAEKVSGSVFFPNEWSTQKVLESIVAVSQKPGQLNADSRAYSHLGEVDGVKIIVNTDDLTGKIIAARPRK